MQPIKAWHRESRTDKDYECTILEFFPIPELFGTDKDDCWNVTCGYFLAVGVEGTFFVDEMVNFTSKRGG